MIVRLNDFQDKVMMITTIKYRVASTIMNKNLFQCQMSVRGSPVQPHAMISAMHQFRNYDLFFNVCLIYLLQISILIYVIFIY